MKKITLVLSGLLLAACVETAEVSSTPEVQYTSTNTAMIDALRVCMDKRTVMNVRRSRGQGPGMSTAEFNACMAEYQYYFRK
jgi:hypothetical protein